MLPEIEDAVLLEKIVEERRWLKDELEQIESALDDIEGYVRSGAMVDLRLEFR